MQFIVNDIVTDRNDNVLLEKWKEPDVTGDVPTRKPEMCIFNNIEKAIKMLNKHILNKSRIALHIDVDVDGLGSGYILNKFLISQGIPNQILIINKDKVHGVQEKHAKFFEQNKIDLIIISDSSTNEIDVIKQFNCDVLVIDHHEVLNKELFGKCNNNINDFVIVNNTLDNDNFNESISWLKAKNTEAFKNLNEYKGDNKMSCGLVVYELLRVYCECFSNPIILENLMLYQWVGTTLLTDSIQLLTPRNQWYMDKTVHSNDIEHSLRLMQKEINKYKVTLDKTYINYTFAPIINKAIRAGQSALALDVVINNPSNIKALDEYKKLQEDAINKTVYRNYEQLERLKQPYRDKGWKEEAIIQELRLQGYVTELIPKSYSASFILEDISKHEIHPNYSGVIAGRLCGENNKNVACYTVLPNGKLKGSFRGRNSESDYRKYFEQLSDDIYAQGHPTAFGFECGRQQLMYLMSTLDNIENTEDTREFFSVGKLPQTERGKYHIVSFDEFKKNGYLLRIGIGNSKVTNKDEVYIKVDDRDVVLKETKGKLYIYNVLGLECKAFKQLSGNYFKIYLEFTNELNAYIKPL